jgi:hypothetical protein
VIDVYLMTQSFYSGQLTTRMKRVFATFRILFNMLRPVPLFYLLPPLNIGFDIISLFTLSIPVEGGVTCLGMQAPMYLFINFAIIMVVVVLFDSSIFVFLKVSPPDFKQPDSKILKHMKVPGKIAALIEQSVVRAVFNGLGRNMKTIIQLVMARMLWSEFLWYWADWSPACEKEMTGSEEVARWGSTFFFYFLLVPMLHLILNTGVYGVGSKKIDKFFKKKIDVEQEGLDDYFINPKAKVAVTLSLKRSDSSPDYIWKHLHTARIPLGYRNLGGESDGVFRFYFHTFACMNRWCSFFRTWMKEIVEDDVSEEELILFEHDPRCKYPSNASVLTAWS